MKKLYLLSILCILAYSSCFAKLKQLFSFDWSPIGSHWLFKNQFKDTERVAFIRVDCIDTFYTVFGARLAEIKNDGIFKKYVFQYLNKDTLPSGVRDNDTFYIKVLKEVVYDYNPKIKEVTIVYSYDSDYHSLAGSYPRPTVPKSNPKWIVHRVKKFLPEFKKVYVNGIETDFVWAGSCYWIPFQQGGGMWSNGCIFDNFYFRMGMTGYFFPYDTEGSYYSGRLIYYYEPGLGYFHRDDKDTLGLIRVSVPESHTKFNQFVQCFPNPTKDNFSLQLEGDMLWNVRTQVTIMDYTGRVLAAPFTINGSKIEVSVIHLPKGVYICSWQSDKNKGVFKVIKE